MKFTEIFDLHCDTAYEMYQKKLPFDSPALDGGLNEFEVFDGAFQVFAVWSDKDRGAQNNYIDFFPTVTNLKREIEKHSDKAAFVCDREALLSDQKLKVILAVEGADLLCGNITRLDALYATGMRVLTLMWKDENCLGGGHNTEKGLTPFGKTVLERCAQLGIIVDISHASRETAAQVLETDGLAVIVSHSNAYSICPHTRNLTDDEFFAIKDRGGVVGINLYPPFLIAGADGNDHTPDELFDAVCEHILYFLELGGESTVCLGADRDGIPHIKGYTPLRFAQNLYEYLINRNIDEKIIKDIFSGNAKRFFNKYLPPKGRI